MSSNKTQADAAASEPPSGDRLDSWKQIAAHLRRDERTVRRWESEGLPVRRHHHKSRAAVFAYKSELDAWWNNNDCQRLETLPHADDTPAMWQTQTTLVCLPRLSFSIP